MPTLAEYTIVSFDQGGIIDAKYLVPGRYKESAAAGVCCGLVLEYLKKFPKGNTVSPTDKIEHLKKAFQTVVQRQEISMTAVRESVDDVQALNEMARHTGLQFSN